MLHWTLPQINTDIIRFTITPTSSAKTITLSNFTQPINCAVEWGDGIAARITTNTATSHTYADTKPRQIILRGILGGFWSVASATGKNLVTSVDEISSKSLLTMSDTFRNCTALTQIPNTFTCSSVTNFVRTFYQCRSITSLLPPLWTPYKNATHTNCFTQCFKSMYGQYGTSCPQRQYVAAVAGQTYYQKYSTGCSTATYHVGSSGISYYFYYRDNGGTRPYSYKNEGELIVRCTSIGTCNSLKCNHTTGGSSPYYSCSQSSASGISTCGSGCKRTYTSGQSAYYKCKKSGATFQISNCAYPYANEASFNAAKSAGWA